MFALLRVRNLEIRCGVFGKCLVRISPGTQTVLCPNFVWFYLHPKADAGKNADQVGVGVGWDDAKSTIKMKY
jgi:hypothetical protein